MQSIAIGPQKSPEVPSHSAWKRWASSSRTKHALELLPAIVIDGKSQSPATAHRLEQHPDREIDFRASISAIDYVNNPRNYSPNCGLSRKFYEVSYAVLPCVYHGYFTFNIRGLKFVFLTEFLSRRIITTAIT